jgi:outer membrane protein assembly factor BamB
MSIVKCLLLLSLLVTINLFAQDQAPRLTKYQPASPLADRATTESWPRFLGPRDDAKSNETHIATSWPAEGPKLVWELKKGDGYTTPALVEGKLVLFHRWKNDERLECRDAETGKEHWTYTYPIVYRDRFGYSNGPRGSPVIDGNLVYTLGVTSILSCVALDSGKLIWQRDLKKDYQVPQYFFGSGSSPLIHGNMVIANVGGGEPNTDDRPVVVAFNKLTGETKWISKSRWGASYASPIAANFHGRERLLVFAGGMSKPPEGGLLLIDPEDGKILSQFEWRASKYESVNATTPVVLGNRVFITETYRLGGIALDVTEEDNFEEAWKAPDFGIHWTMPIVHDGYLYGFHGEREPFAELVCYDWKTGKNLWRDNMRWTEKVGERQMINSPFRGSLLHVADQFLCLGEGGTLLWLKLTPKGPEILQRTQLFRATQTWSTPAIHRGLVYISQHYKDLTGTKTGPRLLCYDFRTAQK